MQGSLSCIHGFLGKPTDWDGLLPEIESIRWDLFGKDKKNNAPPNTLLAPKDCDFEILGNLIRENAASSPRYLMGYSLGGRIALHALLKDPSYWNAAVIVSANPGLANSVERERRLQADEVWAKRFETENWDSLLASWNSQPALKNTGTLLREEKDFSRMALACSLRAFSLGCQEDLRSRIQNIQCSVLWIVGEEDEKFLALGKDVCKYSSKIQLVVLPGAGHRAPWDQPQLFKKYLGHFLESVK